MLSANSCWNLLNFRGALIGGLEASGYRIAAFAPEDANAEAYRESSQEPTKWQRLDWTVSILSRLFTL